MTEMLRLDGSNDFVLPAQSSSVNWGVDVWGLKFGGVIRRHPASGNEGIVGSNTSTTTGITLRQASGDGAAALIITGTFRVASAVGYLELDVYHDYYIYRDSGGTIHWERDGADFSTSTFSTSATSVVRGFGRANISGGFALMDLAYVELIGFTNSEEWRADLSGGTGSTLPTVSGNNLGTLTNFPTDDSQWIGFGGTVYNGGGTSSTTFGASGIALRRTSGGGTSSLTLSTIASAVRVAIASGTSALSFVGASAVSRITPGSGMSSLTTDSDGAALLRAVASGETVLQFTATGNAVVESAGGVYNTGGVSSVSFGATGNAALIAAAGGASSLALASSGTVSRLTGASGVSAVSFSANGNVRLTADISGVSALSFTMIGNAITGEQPEFGIVRLPAVSAITKLRYNSINVRTIIRVDV